MSPLEHAVETVLRALHAHPQAAPAAVTRDLRQALAVHREAARSTKTSATIEVVVDPHAVTALGAVSKAADAVAAAPNDQALVDEFARAAREFANACGRHLRDRIGGPPSPTLLQLLPVLLEAAEASTLLGFREVESIDTAQQERIEAAIAHAKEFIADRPECSGDPASCPENEGFGCCKPNPPTDLEREAAAVDELLRTMGLDPERCRTEGGAINMGRVRAMLADRATTPKPDIASPEVNAACWAFVEAMPHRLPGPIWNDVKPAVHAAICKYIDVAPQPQRTEPDTVLAVLKGTAEPEGSTTCPVCSGRGEDRPVVGGLQVWPCLRCGGTGRTAP